MSSNMRPTAWENGYQTQQQVLPRKKAISISRRLVKF